MEDEVIETSTFRIQVDAKLEMMLEWKMIQ